MNIARLGFAQLGVLVPPRQEEVSKQIPFHCQHLSLFSWHDSFPGNWHYRCSTCGKEVTIPIMSILFCEEGRHGSRRETVRAARQRMVALVGEAFGERWRVQIQQEADRWNVREER